MYGLLIFYYYLSFQAPLHSLLQLKAHNQWSRSWRLMVLSRCID